MRTNRRWRAAACDKPATVQTFRIGLLELEKRQNIERTESTQAQALAKIERT